ncbi:hypothetical protein [Cellvibrio mixtus]|uniref:hypothetical protein n=1 Tax=Cellvibrio mixtus TaxID=39650 RepID=UPI0005870EB9|nr:hypothetical protein [Cellvibrio mixtus]
MSFREYLLLGLVTGLFVFFWLGFKYIQYLRNKKHNTELWGTIFEGITNKLIDLEPVKKPEIYIEKKAPRSGKENTEDDDGNKLSESNKTQ